MARDLQANNRKPSHLIGNLCHQKRTPTEADADPKKNPGLGSAENRQL